MGIKLGIPKTVEVEAATLKLHCKVRDCFTATLADSAGKEIGECDGYVPGFMPGEHYGDYLILDIDLATGQITNWKVPTSAQLKETFCPAKEE